MATGEFKSPTKLVSNPIIFDDDCDRLDQDDRMSSLDIHLSFFQEEQTFFATGHDEGSTLEIRIIAP